MIPRENFAAREIGKYFVRNACIKFSRLQQDSRVLANSRRCFIFFFKWTRERRGANSDPISRFNIPSSRRRFHRNRGTGKLPFYLYRFNAFTGDGNHATVNNVFLSNYPIANRAAPRRSGYALFPINGDSFAISTPRSRKWNTSRWKSSYFFWKCEQSSLLSRSDRKVYERFEEIEFERLSLLK